MRLVTHNLLACVQCQEFPLLIEASTVAPVEAQYDAAYTRSMLARIEYQYLFDAWVSLKTQAGPALAHAKDIPATLEEVDLKSDDSPSLKAVHYAMCGVAVRNGCLKCGACGTKYDIKEFIPNMMSSS